MNSFETSNEFYINGNILDFIHGKYPQYPPIVAKDEHQFKFQELGSHPYIKFTTSNPELLRPSDIICNIEGVSIKVYWSHGINIKHYNKYPLSLMHGPYSWFFITGVKHDFKFDAIRVNPNIRNNIIPLPIENDVYRCKNGSVLVVSDIFPGTYEGDYSDIFPIYKPACIKPLNKKETMVRIQYKNGEGMTFMI